jgi:hypothetical protein
LALEHAPPDKRSAEICLAAVTQNGLALEHAPPDKRSAEIYLAVVTQDATALQFVPKEKQDEKLFQALIDGWKERFLKGEIESLPLIPYAFADELIKGAGIRIDDMGRIFVVNDNFEPIRGMDKKPIAQQIFAA